MFKFEIDDAETLNKFFEMKEAVQSAEWKIIKKGQETLNAMARDTVLSGSVHGFGVKTGQAQREGLYFAEHYAKRGVWESASHPLANLFENFTKRPRVRWLSVLNSQFRRSHVMDRIAEASTEEVAKAGD